MNRDSRNKPLSRSEIGVLGVLAWLAANGLSGVVPDEQILKFMEEHPAVQECADGICQLALDSGSKDNVSCIVIEVAETK